MSAVVGSPLDRVDGDEKVTGGATYAADFARPRLAHAVMVTSTIASGRCTIDAAAAKAVPGVVHVMTPADAPKLPGPNEPEPPAMRALSLLQDDRVHYNGQPIALVVAESLEAAQAGAGAVEVRYERGEARLDFEAGKANAHKPEQRGVAPADVAWGDIERGFDEAEVRIEAVYRTPDENHNPLEPHATLAEWNGDRLTVHDATQGVFGARRTLAKRFGIAADNVRVVSPFVGGGFGCKGSVWSHVVLAAMAARRVGRPVRLVLDRTQMFAPVGHRPATEQHVVLGAKRDGRLTAMRFDVVTPTSALEEWYEPAAKPARMLYACPNASTTHRLVKLDIGVPTFMRAPGEATGTVGLEIAMDELAERIGVDPIELRLRNDAEADPADGKPFTSKHLRECYAVGAERFGWKRRNPKPRSMRDGDTLIGYGMATATYPALRSKAAARARILGDGTALVQAGSQDIGTGTYTIMTQIAADALGLPLHRVRFELGDTDMPETPVSGGSQTAASVGPAVRAACEAAIGKLAALAVGDEASPLHGLAPDAVRADRGTIASTREPSRREAFAAILARHGGQPIVAESDADPEKLKKKYSLHSFGAVFVEVRVDADLGTIRLARLHGVYDVGTRLNEKTARSQLIGGLVWGAGLALFEDTLRDRRDGRIVNGNLAEYHVPVNADIEDIDVAFVDHPDTIFNPLGARGIGEIGITGVGGAIANAIYHATGRRVRDLPIRFDALI